MTQHFLRIVLQVESVVPLYQDENMFSVLRFVALMTMSFALLKDKNLMIIQILRNIWLCTQCLH